ncbi:MAG: DAK2 domain-containing protein [Acidobacteria bacterium]|nr:DAK2 domain-containing protein [Acidobacteriota bacterium]
MERIAAANGWILLRMLESAADWLEPSAGSLDALNVFPVPDGDTGTNMLLTLRAALTAAAHLAPGLFQGAAGSAPAASLVSAAMARGAMEGARGNSGIILSQFFRGLASALEARDVCGCEDFTVAFSRAEAFARTGISDPTEGTILTVLTDVARALSDGPPAGGSLAAALEIAVVAAAASVERTPSLLPVLRESGVVDAGAKGMLLLLEGCLRALGDGLPAAARIPSSLPLHLPRQAGSYGFCTEFLLAGEALPLKSIRARLEREGTSVILVGDERTARVHVHTAHPDSVVEFARSIGSVSRLEVQDLDRQCEAAALPATASAPRVDTAVVALVDGQGLAAVFRSIGAVAVEGDLTRALDGVAARQIILLPNSSGAREAAERVVFPEGVAVRIVPSRNVPQGIAALLAFKFDQGLEANTAVMTRALDAVRAIEVPAGAADPLRDLEQLLSRERPGSAEVVTIYRGAGADESLAERAVAACRNVFPRAVVDCLPGGQRSTLLIVSLE